MESDEVAAALMVRAENKPFRAQLPERALNVGRAQRGAVAPDNDNLVIAVVCDPLDCILKPRRESPPGLPVDPRSITNRFPR